MPANLPVSIILGMVSLILSAIMIRGWSEPYMICLAINAVLVFATRFVAKIEDHDGAISFVMVLVSLLFVAAIGEPAFTLLITVALNGATLFGMRHMAQTEAMEERARTPTVVKPARR
jgi:hypothetical protein